MRSNSKRLLPITFLNNQTRIDILVWWAFRPNHFSFPFSSFLPRLSHYKLQHKNNKDDNKLLTTQLQF